MTRCNALLLGRGTNRCPSTEHLQCRPVQTSCVSSSPDGTAAARGDRQCLSTAAAEPPPLVTIKEVMELTITPATNTLWNVPERPTDEQRKHGII